MNLHVLKPRFIYGYVAHKDQDINPIFDTNKISMMNQLFNNQRFTGMDRIGDQNFYTLSFISTHKMGNKFAVNISLKIQKIYKKKFFFKS